MNDVPPSAPADAKAFSYKGFRFFWVAVICTSFAAQIMSVAVAWQVYDLTRNPLFLGLVGLAQFAPALLLVLVTGLVSDRFSRRLVMAVCLAVELGCAVGLFAIARSGTTDVWPIFAILVALGTARAFHSPASQSLAPNLVPPKALANAVTVTTMSWQFASIVGPAAGGLLYGISSTVPYAVAGGMLGLSAAMVLLIPKPPQRGTDQATNLETMLAGVRYIFKEKVVLGAISLDMFAVLLGGAVALMPVYARDILEVGPWGLGLLRASPGIGAVIVAVVMLRFPVRDHAGVLLLGFVGAFGAATIVFGFSTTVWVAVPALILIGGFDMVSVIIRDTLLQLWTPDEVRGRVSAVNHVFIGASNELGEFRAGVMAAVIGTVAAVTLGGAGTMAVAGLWARFFPDLRATRGLDRAMV